MNKKMLPASVLLLSFLPNLFGQEPVPPATTVPTPDPTIQRQPQDQPPEDDQDVVRITTNLVQIDAVVTKDGKQVTNLKPEDFQIFQDGKPQTITEFSYVSSVTAVSNETATPVPSQPKTRNAVPMAPPAVRPHEVRRTLALVVDDLGISADSIPILQQQLRKFLNEQVQPGDLVSILKTSSGEVSALQQFTTDKRLLSNAVERLHWNHCSRAGLHVFHTLSSDPLSDETIALCQGSPQRTLESLRFILQGIHDLPGRKALVLFSDNMPIEEQEISALGSGQIVPATDFDPGIGDQSKIGFFGASLEAALKRVAELAIRNSVVIYAVDTRGLQPTGVRAEDTFHGGPGKEKEMSAILSNRSVALDIGREGGQLIARETGGFAVYNSNDFGLQRVLDDQRGYYLIGYRPIEETFNKRFHNVSVKVKGSGLTVRTRKGFYGVTEDQAAETVLTSRDQLNKALMSPFGANDVKLRLTTIYVDDFTRGSLLRSLVFLNARDLSFADLPGGMHEATFNLSTVIFGDYGQVVSRQDELVKLRLTQARYAEVQRDGVVYKFDRPIKKFGTFQFRVGLQDTATSRVGAAGQFIEVPNLRNDRLALSGLLLGTKESATELSSGPAVRRIQQGVPLLLVYAVYNAMLDKNNQLPQLTAQAIIYRDGKVIQTGKAVPIDVAGQPDLKRIASVVQVELGTELAPDEYTVQINVVDHLASEKQARASQWIDFTIVK
ncbi:MAG TPA: VWA domain-containing protein [Pyrinomonadaceae bacterium]|nr:VWA domain-containing protein [Pyrinomonadaceae bacterium]